jgi:2-oxoglutarate ferredoxin oxidoreductase subunit beta
MDNVFDKKDVEIAWCPGCGNFGIRNIVMKALTELNIDKKNLCFVSGIGQAAKAPQYLDVSYFNGLHGRALPAASGIKAANPNLVLVVESGDGDMYGEGGNHFTHTIRRNPDITVIVHNNMVYGLTKGQASPTSQRGMKTPIQTEGVSEEPFNPLASAIALDASFVARGSAGEQEKTKEIVKKAIQHRGFSLVDIFTVCVSFNKINTHKWYKENTYYLPEEHNPADKAEALKRALETGPWPLGVFYTKEKPVFEDNLEPYKTSKTPLYERARDLKIVETLIKNKT